MNCKPNIIYRRESAIKINNTLIELLEQFDAGLCHTYINKPYSIRVNLDKQLGIISKNTDC